MTRFHLRVAGPGDAAAVSAVLASAYPGSMASFYAPAVLAAVLPAVTVANAALLGSGSYYVQQAADGAIVACGGWTAAEPGTGAAEPGVGHVRHFGTHAGWVRRGLAAGIARHCQQAAGAAGIHTLRCASSLGAEAFYASVGFRTLETKTILIGGSLPFPAVMMVWTSG